jgi:formate hydrogenlyase transcriptional activator
VKPQLRRRVQRDWVDYLVDERRAMPLPTGTTLESVERDHILHTLAETRWVIGGPKGAACRLGMKRSTLVSRMRKLGITRPRP